MGKLTPKQKESMKDIKELWGAWVRFPKSDEKIVFAYSPMEIKQNYDLALEMKYPYFISRNNSTRYFENDMLEKEYRITDELKVFYSASKEKCVEWLKKERSSIIELYRRDLQRLEQSEIKEKVERL